MGGNANHFLRDPIFCGPHLTQCFCKHDVHSLAHMGHTWMSLLARVFDCNGTVLDRAQSAGFAEFERFTTGLLQVNREKKSTILPEKSF